MFWVSNSNSSMCLSRGDPQIQNKEVKATAHRSRMTDKPYLVYVYVNECVTAHFESHAAIYSLLVRSLTCELGKSVG